MVWSQGEPIANRYWFPCVDHPNERQTTEIIATVDRGLEVLSNGRLVSKKAVAGGKKSQFHWLQSKPHVAYLVTLVAGKFAVVREEWRGKPVLFYVPPDRVADAKRTFGRTIEMLEFFSERFGIEYVWDMYAQVVVEQFVIGGMENTSATSLYSRVMHDERAFQDSSPDGLIAHELGHQWWGDLVTCKDWTHIWLNEGFATYCEVLWAEHKHGRDEADYRLYSKSRSARSGVALTRPIVDRRYSSPSTMFDSRAYPKGGWVVHMLRRRLGDDEFFRAIQRYGTLHAYRTAETSDLRKTFEDLLGVSLERFFYDWTERPGHPELNVKTEYQSQDSLMKISITQTQDSEAFHFPLEIEFRFDGDIKPITVTKFVDEKQQTLFIPVPVRPDMVRVDPRFSVLADIREDKSQDWWREQLRNGPTVPERLRAIEYFAKRTNDADRGLLQATLEKDPFYGVRVEAAAALGKSAGDFSRDALLSGLQQTHPKVRRACADALKTFYDDSTVADVLAKKVQTGDASYFVEAAVIKSLAKVQRSPSLDPLLAALKKKSHADVIQQAALTGIGRVIDPRGLDILLDWTKPNRPRSCRSAAMKSLATFLERNDVSNSNKTRVVDTLVGYLGTDGPRVRRSVIETLRELGGIARPAIQTIETLAQYDPNGRVRTAAEAAVKKMRDGSTSSKELTRLRDEISGLNKRNKDLQERLLKLESK
jgi:aminopeptidase N